jgi:hypothetical protein
MKERQTNGHKNEELTETWTDRKLNRQTVEYTDGGTGRQLDIQMVGQIYGWIYRWKDRQTWRLVD